MKRFYAIVLFIACFWGCSSNEVRHSATHAEKPRIQATISLSPDTLSRQEIATAMADTGALIVDSTYDEVTGQLLERARQHYLAALESEESGDTSRSADEFEYAIGILNELSYYPSIENNKDFNELSRSVIEDYEKYIASIDDLGSKTSIFALRQKLTDMTEMADSVGQDQPRKYLGPRDVGALADVDEQRVVADDERLETREAHHARLQRLRHAAASALSSWGSMRGGSVRTACAMA